MELNFNRNTVDYFSMVTRYNLATYLELYGFFINNNQPQILSYYREQNKIPDSSSFDFLEKMISEAIRIDNLIKINKNSFKKTDQWELLIFLEEIRNKLETVQNTSKWIGSSKSKNSWHTTSIQVNHILNQNETLEKISLDINGDLENNQNDWVGIAFENDLLEKDYHVQGGSRIQLSKPISSSPNFIIKSVIDTLVNEKMYGLDIAKKFEFSDNDIKVLSYTDTVKQSINVLILLKKGDVPEFPNFGIDSDLSTGNSYGRLFYNSIIRQLEAVFETDDSLRNFSVLKTGYENGDLVIDYSVDTMYNLTTGVKSQKL